MKKLKHIWVFSDSIKGHEVQSIALAQKIADNVDVFHCTIRQPWLSFAPRILPRFGRNIIWQDHSPDLANAPDAIISCGRRMAAVGKFYKRATNCTHIQILNPGDNPKKYDFLIVPEHDEMTGQNIITSKGSLHEINAAYLSQIKCSDPIDNLIVLLLGNPDKSFFKQMASLAQIISTNYPEYNLAVCASRRTPKKYHNHIKKAFSQADLLWLNDKGGKNPYLCLLAHGEVFLVTADSINMLSEACATEKQVVALAQIRLPPKHKRFIKSLNNRLSSIDDPVECHQSLQTLEDISQNLLSALHNC